MKKIQKEYQFKYLGDQDYIDINTLVLSQLHFASMVTEIQKKLFPNEDIKIKIKSFKEGTFNVEHIIEILALGAFTLKPSFDYIGTIFSILADYLQIRKTLNGKLAKSVKEIENKVEITYEINGNDNVIVIAKDAWEIFNKNQLLNTVTQKNIEALENDNEINGVEIRETQIEKPIISLPRDDFPKLRSPNKYLDKKTKENFEDTILFIKRPDLLPKNFVKWSFVHRGRPIEALITDTSFIERINNGERFGQGDALNVKLKIYLNWDSRFNTYVETGKFEVIQVHYLIKREKQEDVFQIEQSTK